MATQKRYREYKAVIGSKDSMEPLAIVNGIGPQFGFDVASVDANQSKLTLSTNQDINKLTKYRYLSDKNLVKDAFMHGLITPDGILTVFTGNIELSFNPASFGAYDELLVIATHRYLENDGVENTTTLAIYPNTTTTSMVEKLTKEVGVGNGISMGSFIAAAELVHAIDEVNEVIVGVYSLNDNGVVSYVPVGYEWPEMIKVPKQQYLDQLLYTATLNTRLSAMEGLGNTIKQMANSFNSKTTLVELTSDKFDNTEGKWAAPLVPPYSRALTLTRHGNMLNIKFDFSAKIAYAIVQDVTAISLKIPYTELSSLFDNDNIPVGDKILPVLKPLDIAAMMGWVYTPDGPKAPAKNRGIVYAKLDSVVGGEFIGYTVLNSYSTYFTLGCLINRHVERAFSKDDIIEFQGEINFPLTNYYT